MLISPVKLRVRHAHFLQTLFPSDRCSGHLLQKVGHYTLFASYTWFPCHVAALVANVNPLYSLLFSSLAAGVVGAVLQGFYRCPAQQQIQQRYPKVAAVSGFANGVVCNLLQSLFSHCLPLSGLLATTAIHIASSTIYMCWLEKAALLISDKVYNIEPDQSIGAKCCGVR